MQSSLKPSRHAGLLAVLTLPALFACASFLLSVAKKSERGTADLEVRRIQVDDHAIVYLEGGQGPTLLMLHGFGGDKDNWTRFAAAFTKDYRVVAPDLPGFGESSKLEQADYSYTKQAERVHRFAATLGLERVHVSGNSMGGAIAGLFAARYPERVLSLGLIAAAGVKAPKKSEAARLLEAGRNPLLVENAADFDRLLNFLFVVPPRMPGSVKAYFAEQASAGRAMNETIFDDLRRDPYPLGKKLRRIKAPTFILWGDTDRVIHPSSVDVFRKGIRRSEAVIMEDCGHLPMVERPAEAAGYYRVFLAGL